MKMIWPKIGTHLVMLAGVVLIAYPVYLTFITAFKTPLEAANNYFALPESLTWINFEKLFAMPSIWPSITNSIIITAISAMIIAILVPMVSYPISRNFGQTYYRIVFYMFIFGMFVPVQMLMLPLVKMMTFFHLTNPIGLVLVYLSGSLIQGVFLCVGYLRTVPLELEEAAEIDGCNAWTAFFKVIYPVMRPIVATILIINALWIWNEFLLPLVLLNKDSSYWTLPLFQYNLNARTDLGTTVQFAAYALSIFSDSDPVCIHAKVHHKRFNGRFVKKVNIGRSPDEKMSS
ncbi:carbohydrate ABC transporter permease [Cohnella kolymensis]|uniref:carbohydrate ABC transporter permease n=1 Tax=Cohnella kolymensis TaxID=1590652 RepID=UPI0006960B3D|nr:carbohydrate ABC transporter permease [Cohnella kolymensis]